MMRIKVLAAKLLAKKVNKETQKWSSKPIETQQKVLQNLIKEASKTKFGKDHHFDKIKNFEDLEMYKY